jgi:hypothetical protein
LVKLGGQEERVVTQLLQMPFLAALLVPEQLLPHQLQLKEVLEPFLLLLL